MAEFYAESGYDLAQPLAEKAFAAILSDERFGYVWLIEEEGKVVGYVVLTFRFGMEYGGLMACPDDLFVVPQSRNRGLCTAALVQVKDTTKRSDAVRELAKKFGVTAKEFFWTLGSYHVVAIFEAPDDASMTALGLALGAEGNVRTQTLRAFSREEMNGVLANWHRAKMHVPNAKARENARVGPSLKNAQA